MLLSTCDIGCNIVPSYIGLPLSSKLFKQITNISISHYLALGLRGSAFGLVRRARRDGRLHRDTRLNRI